MFEAFLMRGRTRTAKRLTIAAALLIWVLPDLSRGEDPPAGEITPPHCYEHVRLLREDVEQLRRYMGRPQERRRELPVSGAEPREVYFQAMTLFRKANRLCFEIARKREEEPSSPEGEIRPAHVYDVVDKSLALIRIVKDKLGMQGNASEQPIDHSKTPSDVYRSIVQANRQLNLMLDRRLSPADVYRQVTLAIAYAERLNEQYPGTDSSVPDAPDYEPNKRPRDVYRRLLACYEKIGKIMRQNGRSSLTLGPHTEEDLSSVTPSDVYDITSLIVAELAYLHSQGRDLRPPHRSYDPGLKLPSDCYQRVGILEKQLDQLEELSAKP